MDDKKAIHYYITDDMMLSIISLFRRGQAVFEEVSGLLYRAEDICENLPASVREQELIVRAQDMNHKLSNYDCEYEGQIIVSAMQRLIDGLYEVENTYTNEIRENSVYFQSDVWRSGTGQVGTEHIATMFLLDPEQAEIKALSDYIMESVYKIAEIRQETEHLSDTEIATYFNAIHSYIQRVCPYEYMLYITDGIPTAVQQKMYEKLKEKADIYVEAVQLQSQLLSMEYPYAWNPDFLSMENTLEIVEIFHRNKVYENDKKALFLSQIYVETFGGKYTREKLEDFSTKIKLDEMFDENLANSYVLNHSADYLDNYNENISLSEEEFSNILYSQNKDHYTCNNLVIQRINELKTYIGNVPASPYEISDLIKYRGAGVLQLTHKENYYRFAHYIEVTYRDVEAAQDIRENGCYSEYIIDKYCFISAEWYYFIGPNRVDVDDMIEQITEKILGTTQGEREKVYEAIYNVISE
ncbi:MAG: hypothetical protein J6C06_00380 [Lachnospiraceae bacterium]|nr:hypothetical protein [Lachnospiraceae bacterium]